MRPGRCNPEGVPGVSRAGIPGCPGAFSGCPEGVPGLFRRVEGAVPGYSECVPGLFCGVPGCPRAVSGCPGSVLGCPGRSPQAGSRSGAQRPRAAQRGRACTRPRHAPWPLATPPALPSPPSPFYCPPAMSEEKPRVRRGQEREEPAGGAGMEGGRERGLAAALAPGHGCEVGEMSLPREAGAGTAEVPQDVAGGARPERDPGARPAGL